MSNTVGLMFRETMSGSFTMGATDPHAATPPDHAARHTFTMRAVVDIEDLDRLLSEAEHPGSLSGRIDFAPLGLDLTSSRGVFNLFSPANDPSMKYMIYELGFAVGAKDYYMAGFKEVKDGPVTDLWTATTTLYTQLHEGTDKSGRVVGAGKLTISMPDFLAMITTIRVLNAPSAAEAASAIGRFGRFFLGELWDTYAVHARPR